MIISSFEFKRLIYLTCIHFLNKCDSFIVHLFAHYCLTRQRHIPEALPRGCVITKGLEEEIPRILLNSIFEDRIV